MTTEETTSSGAGLAQAFLRLIGRTAAGLVNVKRAWCPRCRQATIHRVAAETQSTNETIYRCCQCGLPHSP